MSEEVKSAETAQVTPQAVEGSKTQETPIAEAKAAPDSKVVETKTADKPAEEKKVEPIVYDLKLPEGALLDAAHLEKITSFAKEKGLSKEQAQAILERDAASMKEAESRQAEQFGELKAEWVKKASEDKEIGGEHFKAKIESAHRALKAYGSEALLDYLDSSGFGNHPEVIRVFCRIGEAMGEDKAVIPKGGDAGGSIDHASVLYGARQ